MMVMLPVLQLLFFGYAINTDVRNIPTVVFDQDGSAESRDLVRGSRPRASMTSSADVRSYDEISRALSARTPRASAVVVPSSSGGEHPRTGATAAVQLVVDGSDPQTVAERHAHGGLALRRALHELLDHARRAYDRRRARPSAVNAQADHLVQPRARDLDFIVPGLTASSSR
jgi:ABC-2 type transport system permease protein